jgi:hypothetical protein
VEHDPGKLAPDSIRGGNRFSDSIMLKQAAMQRIGILAVLPFLAALALGGGPGAAAAQPASASSTAQPAPFIRVQAKRARPQIRVRPRYPYRNYHSAYPLPYDTEYPGPNAVRQCVDWYATGIARAAR